MQPGCPVAARTFRPSEPPILAVFSCPSTVSSEIFFIRCCWWTPRQNKFVRGEANHNPGTGICEEPVCKTWEIICFFGFPRCLFARRFRPGRLRAQWMRHLRGENPALAQDRAPGRRLPPRVRARSNRSSGEAAVPAELAAAGPPGADIRSDTGPVRPCQGDLTCPNRPRKE